MRKSDEGAAPVLGILMSSLQALIEFDIPTDLNHLKLINGFMVLHKTHHRRLNKIPAWLIDSSDHNR